PPLDRNDTGSGCCGFGLLNGGLASACVFGIDRGAQHGDFAKSGDQIFFQHIQRCVIGKRRQVRHCGAKRVDETVHVPFSLPCQDWFVALAKAARHFRTPSITPEPNAPSISSSGAPSNAHAIAATAPTSSS